MNYACRMVILIGDWHIAIRPTIFAGEKDMTEVTVKSNRPEAVKSELEAALDGQRCMIQGSLERTKLNLMTFEEKYGFTTPELLSKEVDGSLDDDDLELIEWIGETRILERLQSELELLEEIQICL